jgi:hypothetical protein
LGESANGEPSIAAGANEAPADLFPAPQATLKRLKTLGFQ